MGFCTELKGMAVPQEPRGNRKQGPCITQSSGNREDYLNLLIHTTFPRKNHSFSSCLCLQVLGSQAWTTHRVSDSAGIKARALCSVVTNLSNASS